MQFNQSRAFRKLWEPRAFDGQAKVVVFVFTSNSQIVSRPKTQGPIEVWSAISPGTTPAGPACRRCRCLLQLRRNSGRKCAGADQTRELVLPGNRRTEIKQVVINIFIFTQTIVLLSAWLKLIQLSLVKTIFKVSQSNISVLVTEINKTKFCKFQRTKIIYINFILREPKFRIYSMTLGLMFNLNIRV